MSSGITKDTVTLVEVGPRDGLQNEASTIPLSAKVDLIEQLADAGLKHIESGSFVSPKWVPQMASSVDVFEGIKRKAGVVYSALTPNMKGFEAALSAKVDQVAVFTAASESFCQKNINCSIDESIDRFVPLIERARSLAMPVRAYVSCIHGCPYEGRISAESVIKISQRLLDLGCYEVSLGDTIGVATPSEIKTLLTLMKQEMDSKHLALHFHDTYGQAIANIYAALELGYRTFDSSIAGLGGCPYARGASGNVATEDVVYMLEGGGLESGVSLDALIEAGNQICQVLGRRNQSKVAQARKPLPELA